MPRGGLPAAASPFAVPTAMRIHGAVARRLGIDIVAGVYPPGAVLPGEVAFSRDLSVSRTAFREAIRILAAKGLVESRPKTGTRVAPRAGWALLDPEVLAWSFESEPSLAFVRDLFELRGVVEPAAAALAAVRRTPAQLAAMDAALAGMERHTLASAEGRDADQRFHDTILAATGNEMLMSLASSIAAAVGWTTLFKQRRRRLARDAMPDHRALYDRIAAGDGEGARRAMTELVSRALHDTELSLSPATDIPIAEDDL